MDPLPPSRARRAGARPQALGVLAVVADERNPLAVVVSDGSHSWAARPDASGRTELTTDQIEHLVLEAMTAEERPTGPTWEQLI
jgi:hypothetical protein